MRPECVITGLGAVSPLGVGVPAFIAALRAGRSGVRPLAWRHPLVRCTVAAQCDDFRPERVLDEADLARLPRCVPMALLAAREAMAAAGLETGDALHRDESLSIGLFLGTGGGGIDFTLDQYAAAYAGGRASLWTITNATHGNLAGELSIRLGLRGPSMCISTGCASSSDAAGLALDVLRSSRPGAPRSIVVCGADAHVKWEVLHAMELLRVISTRENGDAATASRPFDESRDGFVLGEGAWAMVLEREEAAAQRGARVLGSLLGYGSTCDAYHRVRPSPGMEESALAMRHAIDDAAFAPEQIDLVQYHGTATRLNDVLETEAVKLAFGEHARRLRGSSIKGAIGHPQGACGMASVVAMLGALSSADGGPPFIPPTINLHSPDPACDIDYTPIHARETEARTVLVNCLAFGAKNSALVLRTNR